MSCNLQNDIVNIYYNDYKFFFSKPNVEGVGFGFKYIKGICTCEPAIHVFVSKKISSNCLNPNTLIPIIYKGVKTDVIETGTFNSNCNTSINISSSNASPYLKRIRPIQPGYCMSTANGIPSRSLTGTFGYIVTDNEKVSKTYCLLSVNKTFADLNKASIGDEIIQPAYFFRGRAPEDVVAKLLRFSQLIFSNAVPNTLKDFNTIDASIASYVSTGQVDLINPFIPNIGVPRGIGYPSLDLSVKWTGCSLGFQTERIMSLSSILKIYYINGKIAWFKDISLSTGTALYADYGTLVCDNKLLATGLLFASDESMHVCICSIKTIMDTLKVTLLTA